jgi:hypothetical protein
MIERLDERPSASGNFGMTSSSFDLHPCSPRQRAPTGEETLSFRLV